MLGGLIWNLKSFLQLNMFQELLLLLLLLLSLLLLLLLLLLLPPPVALITSQAPCNY